MRTNHWKCEVLENISGKMPQVANKIFRWNARITRQETSRYVSEFININFHFQYFRLRCEGVIKFLLQILNVKVFVKNLREQLNSCNYRKNLVFWIHWHLINFEITRILLFNNNSLTTFSRKLISLKFLYYQLYYQVLLMLYMDELCLKLI